MKKNSKGGLALSKSKGFTLIELLVVIAIIGILASIVLASLNTARNKGADAKIKAELANARAQAELYYDSQGSSYLDVCTTTNADNINSLIGDAATTAGAASLDTTVTDAFSTAAISANCHDTANGWAAIVSLKAPATTGNGYCVDSTGASTETAVLTDSSIVCGQ